MKNKYRISLLVIMILLAIAMTVGTSYAYWSTTVSQTNSNIVEAGCLEIEINDLDVEGNSTSINLSNFYPISDIKGMQTTPYTVTIKNVCTIDAKYSILMNMVSNSNLTENEIKYHLVEVSSNNSTTMTPTVIGSLEKFDLDLETINEIENDIGGVVGNTYKLGEGVLSAPTDTETSEVTFNLRLWIDNSAGNNVMGDTFEAAISVYAESNH